MYLLDTHVVSETRAIIAGKADPHLVEWLDNVDYSALYISAITVLEIELGCQRLERLDPRQGKVLRRWIDATLASFDDRVIAVDSRVARQAATIQIPDKRAYGDALIAATALTHGFPVVTRHVGNFLVDGLEVINPWRRR